MTRMIFLIFSIFMLSSCVTSMPGVEIVNVDTDEPTLICTREAPTGSHIPVKICRTQEHIEEERDTARLIIRRTID